MLTVDMKELLEYATCSYKHTFSKKELKFDSFLSIKSDIYSKIFDYCLYLKSSDQDITIYKLNEKLNYIWNDIKTKFIYIPTISDKLSIKNKLYKFLEHLGSVSSVVYYAIPLTMSILNSTILFTIYSYYQDGSLRTVTKLDSPHFMLSEKSYSVKLAGGIVHKAIKTLDDSYRHNVYIFRIDTVDFYKPEIPNKKDLSLIIESLVKGIENKIHFPKNDYITCSYCEFSSDCWWSYSNK